MKRSCIATAWGNSRRSRGNASAGVSADLLNGGTSLDASMSATSADASDVRLSAVSACDDSTADASMRYCVAAESFAFFAFPPAQDTIVHASQNVSRIIIEQASKATVFCFDDVRSASV
jgi:hypothetical protein